MNTFVILVSGLNIRAHNRITLSDQLRLIRACPELLSVNHAGDKGSYLVTTTDDAFKTVQTVLSALQSQCSTVTEAAVCHPSEKRTTMRGGNRARAHPRCLSSIQENFGWNGCARSKTSLSHLLQPGQALSVLHSFPVFHRMAGRAFLPPITEEGGTQYATAHALAPYLQGRILYCLRRSEPSLQDSSGQGVVGWPREVSSAVGILDRPSPHVL